MALAANTAHQPWPTAIAATPRTPVSTKISTTLPQCLQPWPRRPLLVATTTTAKAGAADVRPSSPDAVTYSSSISTDIPLYEPPGISFNEYLVDRARVFRAMFPDESRSQRLSDEEWRIQMLPLQFLLLTVHPVVVMRLRHRGGVLELRATKWELRGLDSGYIPSYFDLNVRGSLYADRSRSQCRLRGHLEIAISCVLPPALRLVPEPVLRGVAESVLSRLAERMKQEVDVGIVTDFQRFRGEKKATASDLKATPMVDSRDRAA